MRDGQGLEVSNAHAEAVGAIDLLRTEWLAFGKRLPEVVAAAEKEDRCALLPLVSANLLLTVNSAAAYDMARRQFARAGKLAAGSSTPREQAWLAATEASFARDKQAAQRIHEQIVTEWPQDLISAKVGQVHAIDRGDAEGILRIGERALAGNPENSFVRSMRAFGLEECNRIDEAHDEARKALDANGRDPWAHHVVAHCLEARGRMLDGIAFLRSVSETWEACNSFMYTHNWWHLALFLIDLDRTGEALDLFDTRVWGVDKDFSEDQINAISLLARIELHGTDVGDRWSDVARHVKPRIAENFTPFLDLQYLYGLARAGETSAVTELLANIEDRAERATPSEREAWMDCAVPAGHGLVAHARGDHAEAARYLGQALPHLTTIGGSIAQRGLFTAIRLDAMMKAGWNDAALKILQADDRERPAVPATKRALGEMLRKLGRSEQAMAADYQAAQLSRQYREAAK
jgi:tetratricopeptide (TPR) repeat protein